MMCSTAILVEEDANYDTNTHAQNQLDMHQIESLIIYK